MLTQTKAKTTRRVDLNAVERPALLKIRLKSDANFLTQHNDLNRRGRRASMHGFVEKSKVALSTLDENGMSGYAKKGKKTRDTHMLNVNEHGQNGYQQQAHTRVNTILDNGLTVEQTHISNGKKPSTEQTQTVQVVPVNCQKLS
jgi:hypothetical protein